MKKIEKVVFDYNSDNKYDVLISYEGSEYNYDEKYGTLVFDKEQDAWVLWYWDNNTGDEGVTYYKELEETEEEIESEILDQQKYIANREILTISITKKILWCFLFAKNNPPKGVVVCKILNCDYLTIMYLQKGKLGRRVD